MNDQRLRLDLTELAEEVTVVDLRDRTLRASRRLGIQRAVATTAAALVLIAAATGTAFAIRPDQSPAPLPADTPSVTATPTPTQSASPTPSTSTSDAPGSPPSGGSGTNTPTVKIGKLFYGSAEATDATTTNLRSWRPGADTARLLALPDMSAVVNANVSPDGRRVAWVDTADGGQGTLYLQNVDGSGKQSLRADVDPNCVPPTWSPDSRHLLFREVKPSGEPGRHGVLDTRGGKDTVTWWAGENLGCHGLWSADGQTIAMRVDGEVALFDPDGRQRRTVPGFSRSAGWCDDVTSLAPDGSRIALYRPKPGEDGTDVARDLRVNSVLDTGTGKQVALPLGGRTLRQVYFQTDGSMVVRVQDGSGYAVLLVDEDGRKISETAEPAALKDMRILAVVA